MARLIISRPLLYLNVLSVQHTAVHAVDSRGEEAGRGQAAQGDGDDVTPLHPQHRDQRLLLQRDEEEDVRRGCNDRLKIAQHQICKGTHIWMGVETDWALPASQKPR